MTQISPSHRRVVSPVAGIPVVRTGRGFPVGRAGDIGAADSLGVSSPIIAPLDGKSVDPAAATPSDGAETLGPALNEHALRGLFPGAVSPYALKPAAWDWIIRRRSPL